MTSYSADSSIVTKFGRSTQNETVMTKIGSKLKSEAKFRYGGRPFLKPEVVLSQPWIEISHRNLVCK